MNGVISNGFAPRVFSTVGSVVSVNCTWQDGHHDNTCPVLLRASLSSVFSRDAAGGRDVAGAHLHDAAAMGRSAHHLIGDAERVHDVERQERDMRRLEHVAAGVEDEIRAASRRSAPAVWALPQPLQQRVVELQPRHVGHLARDLAKALDALTRRCVAASSLGRAMATRAMPSRKRGLTP